MLILFAASSVFFLTMQNRNIVRSSPPAWRRQNRDDDISSCDAQDNVVSCDSLCPGIDPLALLVEGPLVLAVLCCSQQWSMPPFEPKDLRGSFCSDRHPKEIQFDDTSSRYLHEWLELFDADLIPGKIFRANNTIVRLDHPRLVPAHHLNKDYVSPQAPLLVARPLIADNNLTLFSTPNDKKVLRRRGRRLGR